MDRARLLMAAAMIYEEMEKVINPVSSDDNLNDRMEQALVEGFNRARTQLVDYRRSRGFKLALDGIQPGWKYIDASKWLPKEKWGTFVSNNKLEWFEWLYANGVPGDEARVLVAKYFPEVTSV